MVQLPMFAFTPEQGLSWLCKTLTRPPEDPLSARIQLSPPVQDDVDWDHIYEEGAHKLDPLDVLSLDPFLADVSSDATGILSGPAWTAVCATQNLLDHLGVGVADKQEVYEQQLYDVICLARLELDQVGHQEQFVPFHYHTERADMHLALVIRKEFKPPVAVIGLAEDF
jgi:hypothetical protein